MESKKFFKCFDRVPGKLKVKNRITYFFELFTILIPRADQKNLVAVRSTPLDQISPEVVKVPAGIG